MYPPMFAVAFGVGCVGVVGYCMYFDKKRRTDPMYKQKLLNRRKEAQLELEAVDHECEDSCQGIKKPDVEEYDEEKIGKLVFAVLTAENPRQILEYIYHNFPRTVFNDVVKLALPVLYERYEG